MADLITIGPDIESQPLNDNFASLNSAKMEKTADSDLNMNGFKLTNLGAPSANNDAARKVDVDAKVSKSGDTMTGKLDFLGSSRGLTFQVASGDAETIAELVDFPAVSTANAFVRFFRQTNTTGRKSIQIHKGDGTVDLAFRIENGYIDYINGLNVTITAYAGNPNGNVAAPPGSICLDTANGVVYRKASGTGNTGWQAMA